jgi:hypothetical protein
MTRTPNHAVDRFEVSPLAEHSPADQPQKSPPVRIQVMAPVWSDCFPGRWEDVSEGSIRLSVAKPVPPGSVVAVRTRSLLIRGRIQRCHNLNQGHLAEASVIEVSPLGHTSSVSRETAGLVRLLLALNKLRGDKARKRKSPTAPAASRAQQR